MSTRCCEKPPNGGPCSRKCPCSPLPQLLSFAHLTQLGNSQLHCISYIPPTWSSVVLTRPIWATSVINTISATDGTRSHLNRCICRMFSTQQKAKILYCAFARARVLPLASPAFALLQGSSLELRDFIICLSGSSVILFKPTDPLVDMQGFVRIRDIRSACIKPRALERPTILLPTAL